MVPMVQDLARDLTTPPLAGRDRRARGQRLADLLSAAAVLVAEMDLDEPADRAGEAGPRGEDPVAAASQRREARETQPAQAAAILSGAREEIPAISGVPPEILGEDTEPKRRLPFIKEFVPKGGDWVAFSRCFKATSELETYPRMDKEGLDALVLDRMLGWAEELEVALPTSDDDDDLTSLWVVRSIQTHLIRKRRAKVVACAVQQSGPHLQGVPHRSWEYIPGAGVFGASLLRATGLTGKSGCTSHSALAFTSRIYDGR
ncbi:unnamed protein product [Lampetra fluviatilis]